MVSLPHRLDVHTALVGAGGVLLPSLVLVGLPQPAQAMLAVTLLAFVPGYALIRLMPLGEHLLTVLVSVAVSLALVTAVSTVLLYLSAWSWQACAVVLGVVTLAACAARLRTVSSC